MVAAAALVMTVLAAVAVLYHIAFAKQKLFGRVSVVVMIMTVRMFLGYIHKHSRRICCGWRMSVMGVVVGRLRIIGGKMVKLLFLCRR